MTVSVLCLTLSVLCLFLEVQWDGLWSVIVDFHGHSHLLSDVCENYIITNNFDDAGQMSVNAEIVTHIKGRLLK